VMARMYEFGDASDPMDPLLAVLRSNYWLTIHVLIVTAGYFAGLVAALFAHVYLFLRLFKLDGGDKSLRRSVARMTYGCICFTLLLSLVGTVLGGIWANDSWGRFWGWDPKENGALMIVLWALFILHARMGGILREWGVILASIFLATVVVFSWWHVNLLGVGLHSYGFSESKKAAVFMFYGIEFVVLLIGFGMMMVEKLEKRGRKAATKDLASSMKG
jgi:ABC-type transport system involved in cytochrome c biogenesis permease subunit